jgi:hypothetical protein
VTTLLYLGFYVWLLGVIFFTAIMLVALRMLGGRENFTEFFNKTQGQNLAVNHIDWAIVIAVIFWPHVIASTLLKKSVENRERETVNEGQ